MTQHDSSRAPWARRMIITSAAGLVLICSGCEQNPLLPLLPGSTWTFEKVVITDLAVTSLTRTPDNGSSLTLYAGVIADPELREAGILIKFAGLDTTELNNMEGARLVLFRRTFADSTADPVTSFDFYIVEASDTAWTESDTGLTIDNFSQRTLYATTQMTEDSVFAFSADTLDITYPEHLEIPVDTLLLRQWSTGLVANNGFLVLMNGGDLLLSFHAHGAFLSPYLALDLHDTTSAGADTTITEIHPMSADLSIYPVPVQGVPGSQPLIQLNHSKGLRSLIDFSDSLAVDPTRPIAGGRLILHTQTDSTRLAADQMKIDLWWRSEASDEGELMASTVFQAGSDSLIMNVEAVLLDYVNGRDFYGLELVVNPQHHDFDQLSFWGRDAPADSLSPRLEFLYSLPYNQVGE